MSRVGILISLFFISGILLFWNPFWSITESKKNNVSQIEQPDFIAQGMTLRQYNDEGHISSQVYAQHMAHYELQDITKFTKPSYIIYLGDGAPKWKVTADTGVFDQRDQVILENNVIISAIDPNENIKSISTSQLTLDLTTMILTSDQKIEIIGTQYHITGVGLKADLNKQHIELIKEIQAVYDNNQS